MHFLVLQHLDIEPPALIGDVLREAGHQLHVIHMHRGDVLPANTCDFSGAVIMGGPQSANDTHLPYIRDELSWLQEQLATGLPMLGICLGAQLMAKAAGASIMPSPLRELGWYPVFPTADSATDPLFSELPAQGLNVFQWHGETFSRPQQANRVASHPEVVQQALRLGYAQYALQFHAEVDTAIIEQWINVGNSEQAYLGKSGITEIRKKTPQHLEEMRYFCREMTKNWLHLIN